MNKVYIVSWSSANLDDDGNAHAYNGIHNIYHMKEEAEKGLVECKDECCEEILEEMQVYGSVKEGYFEIDYTLGCDSCEMYIQIVEKEFN